MQRHPFVCVAHRSLQCTPAHASCLKSRETNANGCTGIVGRTIHAVQFSLTLCTNSAVRTCWNIRTTAEHEHSTARLIVGKGWCSRSINVVRLRYCWLRRRQLQSFVSNICISSTTRCSRANASTNPRRREGRCFYSQSVEVYLGADVAVGRRHDARHDVVVVPAPEVLVLKKGAVVQLGVEMCGERSVEHPAGAIKNNKKYHCEMIKTYVTRMYELCGYTCET